MDLISFIDHTSLNDSDTEESVKAFVTKAAESEVLPAGFCIFPQFVKVVSEMKLRNPKLFNVRVATVANFPLGTQSVEDVTKSVQESVDNGADEVDLVINYKAYLAEGAKLDEVDEKTKDLVRTVKALCPRQVLLKVILETGELKDAELIRRAAVSALEGGTDFLKTSTGKVPVNATPEAVAILLETIKERSLKGETLPVGVKVAGGVKTEEQAREYIAKANGTMGEGWANGRTFRFGASSLMAVLQGGQSASGY